MGYLCRLQILFVLVEKSASVENAKTQGSVPSAQARNPWKVTSRKGVPGVTAARNLESN
jgi:hypothetical protein